MLEKEQTVEQLVAATGIAPSAASHQLRLLRQERLVSVRRVGRHAFYRLHDHHVADLLAAIRFHHEHVRLTSPPDIEPVDASARPRGATRRRTGSTPSSGT
jgi:ArsR family transcriptional regulator